MLQFSQSKKTMVQASCAMLVILLDIFALIRQIKINSNNSWPARLQLAYHCVGELNSHTKNLKDKNIDLRVSEKSAWE